MNTTSPATAASLRVAGAELYYEVRGQGPLLALVGSPMGAGDFAPAAGLLAGEHTVLTTDPRGIGRSRLDDPEQDSTPELRAADLAALVRHLDAGPAAVFGSSGGAVTALAFAQAHPDSAGTVVAHEAPLDELLPDREELHAQTEHMIATYLSGDVLGAWKQFMRLSDIAVPDEALEQMFGGQRSEQDLADELRFFTHEIRATTRWRPDAALLRGGAPRIVVGIGQESGGELCDRACRALACELGTEPVLFPGGHLGFSEQPEAFAARLRDVLAGG